MCDACDYLKVSYNEKANTSLIEQNMLAKLLKDSLERMSQKDLEKLRHELGMTNIDKVIGENKQILIASVLTLFKAGGSHSYALAITVADAMVKKTLGHGLSSVVGKVALTRTLSLLTGWNITGVWTAIYIAGPAYRVTVPACVLVATLRLKTESATRSEIESGTNKTISKTESRTRSK
nr:ubiquinol-cytochrome C chaperone family protein [Helicobacter pylori]